MDLDVLIGVIDLYVLKLMVGGKMFELIVKKM